MTLRGRIAVSMLSVVAISGGVATIIGGSLLRHHLVQDARRRVRQDLNAARQFYRHRLAAMEAALRYTALGERFRRAVADGNLAYLAPRLAAVRESAGIDTLCVTDAAGRVTHRAHHPDFAGDPLADDRVVARVLAGADAVSGTLLVPVATLRREDRALAERSAIQVVPTPKAKPSRLARLDAGMMLCAAAPVRGESGELVGVLRAAILLNRNDAIVDEVRNTVFRDERYRGKLLGVATVFQGDVRISTLALREDGARAIGSRGSAEVRRRVLEEGRAWVGRAWVFDQWYIGAYAPIRDLDGEAIGMLCVGVVEQKSRDATVNTLTLFVLVTLAGLAIAGVVAWELANSISRPISDLASAAGAVARGDFAPALPVGRSDELGSLTDTFSRMARSLKERDELHREHTRLQLTRSERLASIGRLAAGVAHEINNPLTGVVTFAHMLHKGAPEGSQQRQDAETIIEAALRCQRIVRGLLDFSRQSEPHKTLADLAEVVHRALDLTRNQASISRIAIVEELDDHLPPLVMDAGQIGEVAVNVIVNAIDAMPDGGTLTIRTRALESDGTRWAELEIADTGCGIPPENLERALDPFFTTKQTGMGTGLGLAVSYGIVAEHGGRIDLDSEVGRGTTVTVRLPVTSEEPPHEPQSTDPGRR